MLASRFVRSSAMRSASYKPFRSLSSTTAPRDFARVQIVGRVGIEPEQSETKGGQAVINYAVVVNSFKKPSGGGELDKQATWYNISVYNEFERQRMGSIPKGTLVLVEADYKIYISEDQNGGKLVRHSLIQRNVNVLSRPVGRRDSNNEHEDRE